MDGRDQRGTRSKRGRPPNVLKGDNVIEGRSRSNSRTNRYSLLSDEAGTTQALEETRGMTSDRISLLSDDIMPTAEVTPNPALSSQQAAGNRNKVPPISVESNSVAFVHRLLIEAKVVRYTTTQKRAGTVVQLTCTKDFQAVVKHFKSRNVNFHTYQLEEDKTTKIILNGLIDLPVDEVEEILREEGILPSIVRKLEVRNKRYDEHAVYLLHFPKGSTSMQLLRSIKALYHCRVSWTYFATRAGPMQCKRCQLFGHGAANCNRILKCNKCGDEHASTSCPLRNSTDEQGKIPEHKLKCANCGGNHTSTFSGCPKRPTPRKPSQKSDKKYFIPEQNHFPALPKSPAPPSWPLVAGLNTSTLEHHSLPANALPSHKGSHHIPGFDFNEVGIIIQEVCMELRKCQSRDQAIAVIIQLTAKHVLNGK